MIDGVTGYIVDGVDEAVAAVQRIDSIDRAACRRHFESSFSAQRMALDYLETYRRQIANSASTGDPGHWPRSARAGIATFASQV